MSKPTLYDLLKVTPDAPASVIRASWRALAFAHHPDRRSSGGSHVDMAAINQAYEVLIHPERRASYDEQMRLGQERLGWVRSRFAFKKKADVNAAEEDEDNVSSPRTRVDVAWGSSIPDPVPVARRKRPLWPRVVVAALLLGLTGGGGWWWASLSGLLRTADRGAVVPSVAATLSPAAVSQASGQRALPSVAYDLPQATPEHHVVEWRREDAVAPTVAAIEPAPTVNEAPPVVNDAPRAVTDPTLHESSFVDGTRSLQVSSPQRNPDDMLR